MSGGSDSGGPIRLLLVHGSRLRREALAAWLRSCDDFRLVGSAAPAELVLDLPDARRVDVVLVDASDGSTEARRTIERLREERPDLKIFVIGLDRGPEVAVEFIEAGAGGWVERGASRQELAAALHALHAERTRAAPGVLARLLERIETLTRSRPSAPPPLAELTDREHEVLELVADGLNEQGDREPPRPRRGDRQEPRAQHPAKARRDAARRGGAPRLPRRARRRLPAPARAGARHRQLAAVGQVARPFLYPTDD